MSLKALVLCSTAVVLLGGPGGNAWAQDNPAPAASPVASGSNAPDPSVAPRPAATAIAADDDTIVVTGLRRSLQSAQSIKRNSDVIVDSIVAEDIGKLPDVAVSDVAARIVGVQVDRGGGEASRVLIRGLPDFTTTYNNREIFTAEARSVALQDFPAGGIAALQIFKTTTADLVEGGLAGEVNVRSRKPFDFNGFQVAGSAWAQYGKRSEQFTPNGNLLISDRWDTGIGEVGALINFSYTRLHYLDSTRSNTDFVANPGIGANGATVLFPDIQRVGNGEGDRQRPSVNGALQWRPTDGLELYAEALWQGFRNKVSDRELTIPLYGAQSYSNVVLQPGTNVLQSLTATNPARRPDGFQAGTYAKTDTYQYALGGTYDAGPLKVSADLAHTTSKFINSVYSLDTAFASTQTVNANVDVPGVGGPAVSFANGVDLTNPGTYVYRGFFDRQLIARGSDWQARLDLSYDTGLSFLPKIDVGGRFVDRDSHFEDGNRYRDREGDRLPLSAIPLTYAVSTTGFPSDDPSGIRGFLTPTYESLRANVDQLRTLSGFAAGTPPPDPLASYAANEKSYAGYGQIHYAFGPDDGIRFDGVIGARVVRTKLTIDGTTGVGGVFSPITVGKTYTDWLPNVSGRVRFTDELQFRLSATRTRSRPAFSDYNPGQAVDSPPSCVQNTTNCIRNATGGNPDLNSLKSKNYDASLEYYFSRSGSASVAVFRRDLNGFIQRYTQFVDDPTYGVIQVNRPYNTGKGRIDGAEAQVTGFLDIESLPAWARGFGAQANVTYLDAKTGFPGAVGGAADQQTAILGVSKWTYNLDAIYEAGGLSARLSYNRRSAYPSLLRADTGYPDVNNPNSRLYSETTKGITRLDFSASYDLFKYLTLTFDATNILAKPLRVDETTTFASSGAVVGLPRSVRYEESVYSAGIRFRF